LKLIISFIILTFFFSLQVLSTDDLSDNISISHSFEAGNTISSSKMNENFQNLVDEINILRKEISKLNTLLKCEKSYSDCVNSCDAVGGIVSVYRYEENHFCLHTFLTSGTFNQNTTREIDILLVAGGAGGGGDNSGGGGAGGLIWETNKLITVDGYQVIVGEGGEGATNNGGNGTSSNGEDSTVFGLSAIGGGAGSNGGTGNSAGNGGSGGGGNGEGDPLPGLGLTSQGNDGGNGSTQAGGGGGGAKQPGDDADENFGGKGGMGSNDFISGDVFETNAFLSAGNGLSGVGEKIGTYYFLAGGGGGGSINDSYFLADGGYGGGGKGGRSPTSGLPNTGGGGGGLTYPGSTGTNSGGSGIVMIRYLMP